MGRGEIRGQVSMEYLLIVGFSLLLLIPIILLAYSQSATFTDDVTAAQIQKVGSEITQAVNTVYYAGQPTKKTIQVYFPKNINQINITDSSVVFTVQGQGGSYQYAAFAQSNMTGTIDTFSGIHIITVQAQGSIVTVVDS